MEIKLLIDHKGKPFLKLVKGLNYGGDEKLEDYIMNSFMQAAYNKGIEYEIYSPYTSYIRLIEEEEKDEG